MEAGAEDDLPSLMLIGHERVFYRGLLGGNPKARSLGAFTIYAAPSGKLRLQCLNGQVQCRRVAAVPAFAPHVIYSEDDSIFTLCIEPETVAPAELCRLARTFNHADDVEPRRRIERAHLELQCGNEARAFTTPKLDLLFFGQTLERRCLDERIVETVHLLSGDREQSGKSALDCAARAGLSVPRFLHLFKDETSVSFRSFRAWRRARRFLDHANRTDCLTRVALDLGYPDSSHFSHSVRRIFGLKPRSIRRGSRGLSIVPCAEYTLAA